VLIASGCCAQVSFEKGYYTDKNGEKTVCFIRDADWKNTPNSFEYKLDENGATQKMKTDDVLEFAAGPTKYVWVETTYDKSTQDEKKIAVSSTPEWVEANLLLRVIVEGKNASLYYYSTKDYSLFFFSSYGSAIEQLVYKQYLVPGSPPKIAVNRTYISQLNSRVNCANNAPADDKQVPYLLKPLANYFRNFNKCTGEVLPDPPKTAKSFNLRLTPGIDFQNAWMHRTDVRDYKFGNNTTFRIGVDFQFALPSNHGKWAIIAEPNFVYFDSNKDGRLRYQLIEVPVGIRHRFFFSDKSYAFVNAMAFVDFPINHTQTFKIGITPVDIETFRGAYGFTGGVGYAYGRFSLEGRYYPWRDRSDGSQFIYHYKRSSIILGFRLY
jgi:hypothetical protein